MNVMMAATLQHLLDVLKKRGFAVIGPRRHGDRILYSRMEHIDELPRSVSDQQGPGVYRLHPTTEPTYFGFHVAANSWKEWLYPKHETLAAYDSEWQVADFKKPQGLTSEPAAFLGVKACELDALHSLDSALLGRDEAYTRRRQRALIIGVHCQTATENCFCASRGSGPEFGQGFDLLLTERYQNDVHDFLIESGSARGASILDDLADCLSPATDADLTKRQQQLRDLAAAMQKQLPTDRLSEGLSQHSDLPNFQKMEDICIACGNCTMVCPTCFCATIVDRSPELKPQKLHRERQWDSCFNLDFSYIHGHYQRPSVAARYRQWMMHKLVYWQTQLGTNGCVGCGRCTTWCPVGIDFVAVARELAALDGKQGGIKGDESC